MKKILFIIGLTANILLIACGGAKDEKNEITPYPNYDTSAGMEHINMPDSTAPATQNGAGDMKNNMN